MLLAVPPAGAQGGVDYDADDDGLIEIRTAPQLNAVGLDLNGNGARDTVDAATWNSLYVAVYPNPLSGMGCPAAGCTGYELLADLDIFASYSYLTPLGTSTTPYTATFDGNGHSISRLNIDVSSGPAGLFGQLGATGVIRNVGLIAPAVQSSVVGGALGALAAATSAGSQINSSYVSGAVITVAAGLTDVGGLVGQHSGTIRASYATGALRMSDPCSPCNSIQTGGLVGYLEGGTIIASYAAAANHTSGATSHIGGLVGAAGQTSPVITNSYCDSTVMVVNDPDCVGGHETGVSTSIVGAAHPTADLKRPTGYTGLYRDWNIDTDGDGNPDDPWYFGSRRQYPAPYYQKPPPPSPPPYNPAHDHPEIYANPRYAMATACEVRTTGEGDDAKSTSTLTFNLGSYTRPLTLALSLWDGDVFRSLQSQGIAMPELQREGRMATVEVVTDPAQTRFRIDSEYGLNLVLGYADCHTDDP